MNYQEEIHKTLMKLGVKQSYSGYKFVVFGILNTINDIECLKYISKSLYMDIALKYNTTWQRVERNIRTVVSAIWKTDDKEMLKTICGDRVIKKPNNKEFFIILSDYIVKNYKDTKKRKENSLYYNKNTPLTIEKISTQLEVITKVLLDINEKSNETNKHGNYILESINKIEQEVKNLKDQK